MTSDVVSEGKKGRRDTLIPSPPFFFVFGFLYCNIHEYHTHNTTQHNQYLQIKINVCMYVCMCNLPCHVEISCIMSIS